VHVLSNRSEQSITSKTVRHLPSLM